VSNHIRRPRSHRSARSYGAAELEIDAVEELPLRCIGNDEELPDLGGIGIGRQVLVDRTRRVEANLPPVRDGADRATSALSSGWV
jgi:hypothetical protein